jgi:hypothetical protein
VTRRRVASRARLAAAFAAAFAAASVAASTAGCARYMAARPADPVSALRAPVALESVRRVRGGPGGVDSVEFVLRARAPRDSALLLVVAPPGGARLRVAVAGVVDSAATPRSVLQFVGASADASTPTVLRVRGGASTAGLPDGLVVVDSAVSTLAIVAPVRADARRFTVRMHWYVAGASGAAPLAADLTRRTWRPDSSQVHPARVRTMPFPMVMGIGTGLCLLFLLATTR